MSESVTFAVFADLHVDIMHDSIARVQAVIGAAKQKGAQFLVHLGDLTYPEEEFMRERFGKTQSDMDPIAFRCTRNEEKREVMRLLRECGLPVWHTLGNHECDAGTKEMAEAYFGMSAPFYSFDCGGFHFVVLDGNFMQEDGRILDYENTNYQHHPRAVMPVLPQEQIRWLEEDVIRSGKPTVVFSHQSLTDTQLGIRNHEEFQAALDRLNAHEKRVLLCANGHAHIDGVRRHGGVYFWDVNSISNIWIGMRYACVRYSEAIDRDYPYLKGTAPYRDPLYAIVTLTPERAVIEGTRSEFAGPSPYDLGFPLSGSEYPSTAEIQSRTLVF